jgi:peptidoglycan lytic transglycosylase
MRRTLQFIILGLIVIGALAAAAYFGNQYWIHRYDELIARNARVYRLSPSFVWSVIYEETYFRTTVVGDDNEVGLMQVTPAVAREWAKATGLKEFEKQTAENVRDVLTDPERNIQVGCWYLERLGENYRDFPAESAMTLAAYNAGASRVTEWTEGMSREKLSEEAFISAIKIASTKTYVKSILSRFRNIKTVSQE